jgi:hypothetical protein
MLRRGEEAWAYLTYRSGFPSVKPANLTIGCPLPGPVTSLANSASVPHWSPVRSRSAPQSATWDSRRRKRSRRSAWKLLESHRPQGENDPASASSPGARASLAREELLPIFGPRFAKIRQTGALLASCRGLLKSVAQIRKFIATRRSVHGQTGS